MTMTRFLRILLPLVLTTTAFAESADLFVNAYGQTYPGRVSVLFAMSNSGPDAAKKAVLTIDVPEGLIIDRFSYGAGDVIDKPCDRSQRPWRCEVGDIQAGPPFHYGGIDIRTPVGTASYTIRFTLTSETPDPDMSTNTSSVSFETHVESDLSAQVYPQTDRVDPGGAGQFIANLCNFVRENQPPTVRVEFTAAGGTITRVDPASGFTCRNETSKWVCTIPEFSADCAREPFRIETRASDDRKGGEVRVTMTATGDVPDINTANNQDTEGIAVYRWLTVDNIADAGPGSLRQAILDANANCSPGPCRIVFEIPLPVPAEGYFTITPESALPSITADRVTLEGSRQTALTGDTNPRGPEIAIDGRLAHRGLRMLTQCEGVVDGLAIGNFHEDFGLWYATGSFCDGRPDRREIVDSHIGANPTGTAPWPNERGLRLDFATGVTVWKNVISDNQFSGIWMWRGAAIIKSNFIAGNGASGAFLGPEVFSAAVNDNVIRDQGQMGIAVARGADLVQMRRNLQRGNAGLGIDWGLDGVSPTDADDHEGPSNAPVLLAATYDAATNRTTILASIKSTPLGPYFNYGSLDVYANTTPDGDGEQFLTSTQGPATSGTITVTLSGDYRGRWINATWTREHLYGSRVPGTQSHDGGYGISTSQLSNTVLVQ